MTMAKLEIEMSRANVSPRSLLRDTEALLSQGCLLGRCKARQGDALKHLQDNTTAQRCWGTAERKLICTTLQSQAARCKNRDRHCNTGPKVDEPWDTVDVWPTIKGPLPEASWKL